MELSIQHLQVISELIGNLIGFHFPPEKWKDLERGVQELKKNFNFNTTQSFIDWLMNANLNQSDIETIASRFTVGETYFFRDKAYFDLLEKEILPSLIEKRRNSEKILRLWSAGCSSGEEPYSLAILLMKLIPDIAQWNITILASDINMDSQHKLMDGIYTEWSFRNVDPEIKKQYFNRFDNNKYKILFPVKKLVTAIYLNLVTDSYPSLLNNTNAMDIIFCRNVLMYFAPDKAESTIDNLSRSLINEGYLFVGGSESHLVQNSSLKMIFKKSISYYQKNLNQPTAISFEPLVLEIDAHHSQNDFDNNNVFEKILDSSITVDDELNDDRIIRDTFKEEENDREKKLDVSGIPIESKPLNKNKYKTANTTSAEETELLARTLANQGELHEALELLDKGIHKEKCNINLYYLKTLILLELGLLSEAISELKKTIYLDPDFILAYFTLGNIARQQGKEAEAKKAFSTVITLIRKYSPEDVLPGSEGITAARMKEIIELVLKT